jgi:hypothetical protein
VYAYQYQPIIETQAVKTPYDFTTNPIQYDSPEHERAWLQHELAEAYETIRRILRQIEKDQSRSTEITKAYKRTVETLVELGRQNAEIERERDFWRARASAVPVAPSFGDGTLTLTSEEISAVRRAIARLHHPDTGGDAQRMQLWNAALDALEP